MRARAARLTLGAAAWIGIGAAAILLVRNESQIGDRRARFVGFDARAHEAAEALGDARAAQQAYVAAGQGVAFWMPRVADRVAAASRTADELRASAFGVEARAILMEASAHLTEFASVDRRARELLGAKDTLRAGDVVFGEGSERARTASQLIEAARVAERQAIDRREAQQRLVQSSALGGAALLVVAAIGLLAFRPEEAVAGPSGTAVGLAPGHGDAQANAGQGETAADSDEARHLPPTPSRLPRGAAPVLKAAADLCTEFAQATSLDDVTRLLGRAAEIMDASGVVIWAAGTPGGDLRPALAHGYPLQLLARMPAVPRSDDNAAAAAYRTGRLQVVRSHPQGSAGAVVAPLLGPDGCIGALTAEIRDGSETSDAVQALATLFAAQIAGVLVPPAAGRDAAESRMASA